MIHPSPARSFPAKSVSPTGFWSTEALCAIHTDGKAQAKAAHSLEKKWVLSALTSGQLDISLFLFQDNFSHATAGDITKLLQ